MACQILFYFICFFSPAVEHFHFQKNVSFRFAKQQAPINMQRRLDVTYSIIQAIEFEISFGNKAKGRISKRVLQENKAHQIFRKKNIYYPLIRTTDDVSNINNITYQSRNMSNFRKIICKCPRQCSAWELVLVCLS